MDDLENAWDEEVSEVVISSVPAHQDKIVKIEELPPSSVVSKPIKSPTAEPKKIIATPATTAKTTPPIQFKRLESKVTPPQAPLKKPLPAPLPPPASEEKKRTREEEDEDEEDEGDENVWNEDENKEESDITEIKPEYAEKIKLRTGTHAEFFDSHVAHIWESGVEVKNSKTEPMVTFTARMKPRTVVYIPYIAAKYPLKNIARSYFFPQSMHFKILAFDVILPSIDMLKEMNIPMIEVEEEGKKKYRFNITIHKMTDKMQKGDNDMIYCPMEYVMKPSAKHNKKK